MANEWLTQLMAGLGGAFTGATAANERIALEQERERQRQERALEKQRLENQRTLSANLFKGPLTGENISKFLGAGGDIQTASAARLLMPESARTPTYTQRTVGQGGRVMMTDPTTGRSIYAMTPEGQPMTQRSEVEPPMSRLERGEGLSFFRRYLSDESLRQNPTEATRRVMMVQELKNRFPGITEDEIGQMLMGGSRASTRFVGGRTGTTGNRPTGSLDED
jgi:hypothetical protein